MRRSTSTKILPTALCSTFLKLLCVAGQRPDATSHLRGPPENKPQPDLNSAVGCSSRVLSFELHLHAERAIMAHLIRQALHDSVAPTPLDLSSAYSQHRSYAA
jgi:hypothetical protein